MPSGWLSLAYSFHMAATVVWIGGLFFHSVVLAPVLDAAWDPLDRSRLLERIRRRFDPLAWLSLAVLVGTGLMQMSAHPEYQGLLAIEGRWAAALLAKHLAVGGMLILGAYQTWVVYPRLTRQALRQAQGLEDGTHPASSRRSLLARLSLLLGLIVLVLTAVARTS